MINFKVTVSRAYRSLVYSISVLLLQHAFANSCKIVAAFCAKITCALSATAVVSSLSSTHLINPNSKSGLKNDKQENVWTYYKFGAKLSYIIRPYPGIKDPPPPLQPPFILLLYPFTFLYPCTLFYKKHSAQLLFCMPLEKKIIGSIYVYIKGTVQRDFRPPVFFIVQTSLGHWSMGLNILVFSF